MSMRFKREDYMSNTCSHQEYYSQFITPKIKQLVEAEIGIDRIKSSKDEHFNDIPLARWDHLFYYSPEK